MVLLKLVKYGAGQRLDGWTVEYGTDGLSRNVGNYLSTLRNTSEEERLILHCGEGLKLSFRTSSRPEIIGNFIRWSSLIMCQVMCNYRASNELNAYTFRLQF